MESVEEARASAIRDAFEVVQLVREVGAPAIKIATTADDSLISGKTGFDDAWARSKGGWPDEVWRAYAETFRLECGKANVGLIHATDSMDAGRGPDSHGFAESHVFAVDLERWRVRPVKGEIRPGEMASALTGTGSVDSLLEPNKLSLRERLFGRK